MLNNRETDRKKICTIQSQVTSTLRKPLKKSYQLLTYTRAYATPLKWVSKVPRQKPSDADNDNAVCDDSPAETTTSDLSQLATVLQRDIEGKSYLFSQSPPVLIPLLCSEIKSLFLDMKQTRLIKSQ